MSTLNSLEKIGERLRLLRTELGHSQSQFGALLEEGQTTISAWERGYSSIPIEKISGIVARTGVEPIWLISGIGPMMREDPGPQPPYRSPGEVVLEARRKIHAARKPDIVAERDDGADEEGAKVRDIVLIARYDAGAGAGYGIDNVDPEVAGHLAFQRAWLKKRGLDPTHLSAVGVIGDSMEPSLDSGDVVLVDERPQNLRRAGIFVFKQAEELRVKRLVTSRDGGVDVISDNSRYQPEHYTAEEAAEIQIIGRVVWLGRNVT